MALSTARGTSRPAMVGGRSCGPIGAVGGCIAFPADRVGPRLLTQWYYWFARWGDVLRGRVASARLVGSLG